MVGWHEVTGDGCARRRAREIEIARVARRRTARFGRRREDRARGFSNVGTVCFDCVFDADQTAVLRECPWIEKRLLAVHDAEAT